jgi:hypothetical protein
MIVIIAIPYLVCISILIPIPYPLWSPLMSSFSVCAVQSMRYSSCLIYSYYYSPSIWFLSSSLVSMSMLHSQCNISDTVGASWDPLRQISDTGQEGRDRDERDDRSDIQKRRHYGVFQGILLLSCRACYLLFSMVGLLLDHQKTSWNIFSEFAKG